MLVADEFYHVAQDESSGKPLLHARILGLGLAAALLGELMLAGHLGAGDGNIVVINQRPPEDALAHTVLDQIIAEPQHRDIGIWLAFLGKTAPDEVGQRMLRAGLLTRSESRGLLRTTVRYLPTDRSAAAWPETRLRRFLTRGEQLNVHDGLLAGLVFATDLTRKVLWDGQPQSFQYLAWVISNLPPPLRELVAKTHSAAGNVVVAHRT